MSVIIKQIKEKIKSVFIKTVDFLGKDIIFYSLLIIFASSISFFLGSLYQFNQEKAKNINNIKLLHIKEGKEIYYIASKHGKNYYLPWCYRGSEKYKIKFKTQEEAKKAGYKPAKSCPEILEK